ncbi:MAG: hypothetical protein WHT46_08600 [Candidatus Geothermincolales bacterium]
MAYIKSRRWKSGRVSYIVRFKDQHGKRREKSAGPRRKDAEELLRRILEEVAKGTYGVRKEDPTLFEFSETFLKAKKWEVKPSTYNDYREVLANHVLPFFGKRGFPR